jgi:LmbE family N-acetylglucosaminyl deacetylase
VDDDAPAAPAGPAADDADASESGSLPRWNSTLVVVAHPDDESFGLGGVIGAMTARGGSVHILCYTHGEASTVNHADADLHTTRAAELRTASAVLGVTSVRLLEYADGGLARVPGPELAAHVAWLAASHDADGLLVFDDTGITGHLDHQAATRAAVDAAARAGLPVLAWTLPAAVASQLTAESGQRFAGQQPERIDLCVRVDRAVHHRAALSHVTQISPAAVLWKRLRLLGDREHLRWLLRP